LLTASRWWALLVVPAALLTASWDANRLLHLSGFALYSIPSESMEDTIDRGDRILVDLRAYEHSHPAVGDIVVFRKGDQQIVKRVVATGGDTIFGIGGKLIRKGAVLNEPYARHVGPMQPQLDNFDEVRVPAHMLFVAGDNRDVSFDSRMPDFGLVDESALIGKPLYIYRSDRDRSGKAIH
jgi:signal peptidase I